MKFQRAIKRIFDFIIALAALIILSPLFLAVAILIKIDSEGPVFFRQLRIGKDAKPFKIWKFRSMVENAQNIGLGVEITDDDYRITRVGHFIRRFGIDEFPQVIDVLLGRMSLVGPRPALPHQVEKYTAFEKRRLEVEPGMTNINMLKGWNILPWKKRIEWDIWYINNWSLLLDFKILFLTPFIVLLGRGQYGENGKVEDYK